MNDSQCHVPSLCLMVKMQMLRCDATVFCVLGVLSSTHSIHSIRSMSGRARAKSTFRAGRHAVYSCTNSTNEQLMLAISSIYKHEEYIFSASRLSLLQSSIYFLKSKTNHHQSLFKHHVIKQPISLNQPNQIKHTTTIVHHGKYIHTSKEEKTTFVGNQNSNNLLGFRWHVRAVFVRQ